METSILLDKSAEFIDKTIYMAGYYSFLQNENDGCFGADSQSESNILPTYCAVNYYNLTGVKEYKQEAIVETMKACQTIEGYYLPIMERDSDLESTYYAYKILKLIHSQSDYEEKIKKFISNQELSSICQNQADLLFYYKLNDELYGKNELCDVSADLIQKLKVSLRENDLSNQYFSLQAVNSLETLKMFDEKADDETSEKIVENIKKRGVEKTESDYLTECYDLLILKLIDYNDADGMIIEKSERVKESLIEGYKEIDQEYRLFYLYWGIRSLSGWNIEIAELLDYDVIEEEILEYENNAVYSIGKDDYPSLSSTYYCLYIMQNIKGKQNQ